MTPENLQRLQNLDESFKAKYKFHEKKCDRARKWENREFHLRKATLYRDANRRAYYVARMATQAHNRKTMPEFEHHLDMLQAKGSYEYRLKKKEEGRVKFQTLHRYGPWFMQQSLGADYGTYQCEVCSRQFYHSPSTIYKGPKTIYDCVCGHCTNSIITADHGGENPFN